jgi:hypothetical protein
VVVADQIKIGAQARKRELAFGRGVMKNVEIIHRMADGYRTYRTSDKHANGKHCRRLKENAFSIARITCHIPQ